jgi:hypothetical protein
MCQQLLPLDCFAKSSKGFAKRQSHCRECRKEYDRQHYQRYKETHRKKRMKWEAAIRQMVLDAKAKPCLECGIRYHPLIMEFDHREGEEKALTLGASPACRTGLTRITAEIAKCDVLCPTCHRIRTMVRLGKITREEAICDGWRCREGNDKIPGQSLEIAATK